MKDYINPNVDAVVEAEAAEWLIRLDGDTPPDTEEIKRLKEWLDRSPAHRQALAGMAKFWSNNILTELSTPLEKNQFGAGSTIAPKKSIQRKLIRKNSLTGIFAAAALASILVVIFLTQSWFGPGSSDGLYVTAVGQQQEVILADGSTIQLNTNTQVSVTYNEKFRMVHLLQGEAYFTVAKDKARPFRVYAGNGRIEAVGTAFSVYRKNGGIDVIVTEGVVALSAIKPTENAQISKQVNMAQLGSVEEYTQDLGHLKVGQKTTLMQDKAHREVSAGIETINPQQLEANLSWRHGYLSLKGEPLQQVIDEINRYTGVTIDILDPQIKDIKIGGQLQIGNTEAMLDALEANFGLKVKRLGYNYVQLSLATE